MAMRVDEARNDGLAADIHGFRRAIGEGADFVIRADGHDALACNGDGLGIRLSRVNRDDLAVMKDQLRPLAQDGGERRAAHERQCGERARPPDQVASSHSHWNPPGPMLTDAAPFAYPTP